jgi:Family of unknown function (DUF5694)
MKPMLLALALTLFAANASARETPFDPRDFKGTQIGEPTRVLTIGSVHLLSLKPAPTADMIAPLLDKLAAFKPDIITHEGISGEQCDDLSRHEAIYPGVWDPYCWGVEEAKAATGLTVAQALVEVEKTLNSWPADPAPAARRRLASLFLAANDRHSAQVQWLRLPAAERHTGDGVDDALLKLLTRAGAKTNESYDVAVALAVRLGLERVYAVDDHTADAVQLRASPGIGAALGKLFTQTPFPAAIEMQRREAALKTGQDMLDYYRFLNRPGIGRAFVTAEYGAALKQDTPERFGRQHVAWWEVRNLRMVANIRAAFGNHPGARVLNIVGASHKPYYDAYLRIMSDVQVIDAESVLK